MRIKQYGNRGTSSFRLHCLYLVVRHLLGLCSNLYTNKQNTKKKWENLIGLIAIALETGWVSDSCFFIVWWVFCQLYISSLVSCTKWVVISYKMGQSPIVKIFFPIEAYQRKCSHTYPLFLTTRNLFPNDHTSWVIQLSSNW